MKHEARELGHSNEARVSHQKQERRELSHSNEARGSLLWNKGVMSLSNETRWSLWRSRHPWLSSLATCFIGVTQLPCYMLHWSDRTPLLHASLECSNSIPCYMLHWCTTLLQTLNLRIHTLIGLTVFLLDFNKTPWLDGASVINGLTESRNCSCVIIF